MFFVRRIPGRDKTKRKKFQIGKWFDAIISFEKITSEEINLSALNQSKYECIKKKIVYSNKIMPNLNFDKTRNKKLVTNRYKEENKNKHGKKAIDHQFYGETNTESKKHI